MKQQIVDLLRVSFSGLDFWRLSKRWKEIHYNQVADALLFDHAEYKARIKQLESILAAHSIPIPNEPTINDVMTMWDELKGVNSHE